MSGLVLKLQPGEQILVNGVVMQNGDRRAQLRIKTKDAHILRLRDAIHPDEANTPVKRVYYAAQLIVAGEGDPAEVGPVLENDIELLLDVFRDADSREALSLAHKHIRERNFYFAMRELKRVLPMEAKLLAIAGGKDAADEGASIADTAPVGSNGASPSKAAQAS
ncbi:MAG: flagellar biosynthesis repressor FlbT [Pseudomonadota bacterium]